MAAIPRVWRNWVHGRKFAKKGKKCRFTGKFLHVDGHVELGDYCRIRDYCILRTNGDGKIIFGDRSGCSNNVIIEATTEIRIGNGTGLAEFVVVRDTDHLVYGTDANWRYTPQIARPVTIGNECLIGSRVYISPGVTIGDGAVVHAGSVVSKDIGPYEIWAGMPARFVAHRTDNVPPSKMRQFRDLIEKYGIRDDRRADDLERADDKDV